MPNPLKKLPSKPGRTAPSSRVKKIPKEGNKKFIGPRSQRFEEGTEAARSAQADYGVNQVNEMRGRGLSNKQKRQLGQEVPQIISRSSAFDTQPQDMNDMYSRLSRNLSPENKRMLDILMGYES